MRRKLKSGSEGVWSGEEEQVRTCRGFQSQIEGPLRQPGGQRHGEASPTAHSPRVHMVRGQKEHLQVVL